MTDTYLGRKGYTLIKNRIESKELFIIRRELDVSPNATLMGPQPSFQIYQESINKLYIPRYFGLEYFGKPDTIILPPGKPINVAFEGELRDYQNKIIDKYMNHITKDKDTNGGGLLDIEPGKGKTVMALDIISKLKLKTLVIVHKTFLLNQWKERIEQFLPQAKVGRIQGDIYDTKDKDIVIGMLQSLSQKTYPLDAFDEFGLSVYDECHHLSAEVFSRVMMKIVTTHTLGLSGTMTRKDGLSKVFKMFIGPVIHKEISKKDVQVLVKGIYFKNDDEDFSETKYDYRGNPAYSSMITKLCVFNPRSEFILTVLRQELAKNPNQQIMILAHNKTLITYLFKAIEHHAICTVGYYIGGMKEPELKKSETKTVIIGTYAMASEGLDIKTLTTLIMATPKTDVCQSVGRILRTKHIQPMVIDIIDKHDLFKNQWRKRLIYYKKQKYEIMTCDSNEYLENKWLNVSIKKPTTKKKCILTI